MCGVGEGPGEGFGGQIRVSGLVAGDGGGGARSSVPTHTTHSARLSRDAACLPPLHHYNQRVCVYPPHLQQMFLAASSDEERQAWFQTLSR